MKKRLFSILLALCMVLCLVPTTAFAESETEETPVCTCKTACTAEAMNAECSVCGAEGALAENCGKYAAEESGQTGTSKDAPAITAADVQALIDALPEAETISEDNAADVEVQLEAIDEAKVQLSDEDFAVLDFTRYDAAVAALMALSGEPDTAFAPQTANDHTHCYCGGSITAGDHASHSDVTYTAWDGTSSITYTNNTAYVYLTGNATLSGHLTVDGKTLYLCLNGKTLASNGTAKIQVKNGGRLVLCDCQGSGTIKGATQNVWGGACIYLYNSTLDMFGGKLTGGKVTGNGGGAICHGGMAPGKAVCHVEGSIRTQPARHGAQQTLHGGVHQRRPLCGKKVAAHHHNDGIQHQCAQTAGDECTELLRHLPALGPAAEHERPVGGVGKQDAQDVVQHVAPAVGGGVAEQLAEQGIQHDVEQGGQHAKDQVTEHFPVLFEKIYQKK